MKYCTNCGRQLADENRFCTHCGQPAPEIKRTASYPAPNCQPPMPWNPAPQPPVYQVPAAKPKRHLWIIPVAAAGCAAVIAIGALGIGLVSRWLGSSQQLEAPAYSAQEPEEDVWVPVEAPRSEPLDSVDYIIEVQDHSYRNEAGDAYVEITYARVILQGDDSVIGKINEAIEQDEQGFLTVINYVFDDSPEEWDAYLEQMYLDVNNLFWTADAEVMTNSGGILSIRLSTGWFMGGVYNGDHYCLNFDLHTGQQLQLADLSDLPEEEFIRQLRDAVCADLEPEREYLFSDPADVLANYTLEDFNYYLDNGQIVLEFPTYTFGPGAMGSTTVYTGIFVNP